MTSHSAAIKRSQPALELTAYSALPQPSPNVPSLTIDQPPQSQRSSIEAGDQLWGPSCYSLSGTDFLSARRAR